MKASALALAILLAVPGCSAKADVSARSDDAAPSAANIPARPNGPVLDEADILPAKEEAALDARLREYWNRNHTALVVVSVNSLDGEPIERFSLQIARDWGIGDAEAQRGLLVLVAPTERRVRIEVSCGLENIVTDVFAGQVIREKMTPRFRQGALDEGTLAGVDALIDRLDAADPKTPSACRPPLRNAA